MPVIGSGRAKVACISQFMYVIGESELGPVKIGISDDPKQRLKELQIGNARQLYLYGAIEFGPAASTAEAWVHRELKPYQMQREWFSVDPERALELVGMAEQARDIHLYRKISRTPLARQGRKAERAKRAMAAMRLNYAYEVMEKAKRSKLQSSSQKST